MSSWLPVTEKMPGRLSEKNVRNVFMQRVSFFGNKNVGCSKWDLCPLLYPSLWTCKGWKYQLSASSFTFRSGSKERGILWFTLQSLSQLKWTWLRPFKKVEKVKSFSVRTLKSSSFWRVYLPRRKRLHFHSDEQHAESNRLKLREEKFRLYVVKHCLLMEPMCRWHILRKRQSMPATGSFKSGKAEMLSCVATGAGSSWEIAGDGMKVWDLHVQRDRGCHFIYVPCAQCWHAQQRLGLLQCSPAWAMQCFPNYRHT